MRALGVISLVCFVFTWASLMLTNCSQAAESSPCPDTEPNWVRVTVDAPESPQLANKLLEYLQAELAPHRIGVCTNSRNAASSPLASIHIVHSTAQQVGIEVQVEDSITNKRVARQLNLRGVPTDAHAMIIALGAAELLRASWAEIKLRRSHASQQLVPNSVQNAVDDELTQSPTKATLGVHLAGEEFSRGLRQGGVDATAILQLIEDLQLTLRLGAPFLTGRFR